MFNKRKSANSRKKIFSNYIKTKHPEWFNILLETELNSCCAQTSGSVTINEQMDLPCKTKVSHFDHSVVPNKAVSSSQVTMNELSTFKIGHTLTNLYTHVQETRHLLHEPWPMSLKVVIKSTCTTNLGTKNMNHFAHT